MICDPEIWQVAMGIATAWRFGDQEDERTHVAEKNIHYPTAPIRKAGAKWGNHPKMPLRSMKFYNMIPDESVIFEKSPFHGKSSRKCIGSECRVKSLWPGSVLRMDLMGFRDRIDLSNREEMSLSTAQPLELVKKVANGNRLALPCLEWWLKVLDQHVSWMNLEFGDICCVELSTAWSSSVM